MRRILIAGLVVVVAFGAGLLAMTWLSPSAPERRPQLADSPPLKPATRTSVVVAPTAIALTAIRDALDAQAPRDLSGKRENPLGQWLQNAELGWTMSRGALASARRPEGLTVMAPLTGTFRLTGEIGAQIGDQFVGGVLGALLNDQLRKQGGSLAGRALDQRAEVRGNILLAARPALTPDWRLDPNLSGQTVIGDANLSIAAVKLNLSREVKPLLDRAVAEQVNALQPRLGNDPLIEQVARREWAKMCRAIPLGKAAAGMPDLWLEVRPVRAVAAQPKIDAAAVTLTIGVHAETRISPTESKPDCPFPATVEIVPPMEPGDR